MIDRMMMSFLKRLEREFVTEGGIKERMHKARTGYRQLQDARLKPEPKEKPPKTACQCPLSAPLAAWCRPLADSSDSSVWGGN